MAYIYKITNRINEKCYIGKTERDPQKRFREHISDSKRDYLADKPLFRAFNKYGLDNFIFEVLEETDDPNVREKYYIEYFNSYKNGYNATLGGDGKTTLDYEEIIKDYCILQNITEVAKKHNCYKSSVRYILKNHGVEAVSAQEVMRRKHEKRVLMLDKESENIIREFKTYNEAGRYLLENNYSQIGSPDGAGAKVSLVCRGKRQTFAGFKWRVENN